MKVEIWSDVACPFCYIGKRGFEDALARFEHAAEVEVVWRSFQLDPTMPARVEEGLTSRLARKYGKTLAEAQAMNDGMVRMAAEVGLDFHLDIAQASNTRDAHRVLHLAREHGLGDAAKERLLRAYFTEGELMSDHATLVRLAVEVGLPEADVTAVLAGDDYGAPVDAEGEEAHNLGIGGVPAFVLDRRFLVTGAQPADQLLGALQQAWATRPEAESDGAPAA